MSDNSELKKLAEAATPGPWECREADGTAAICHAHGWVADDFDEQSILDTRYMAAANPAAVLALIADLDEARNGMKHSCAIRLKKEIERLETERDQFKAENERLTKAVGLQEVRRFVGQDDQKKIDELVDAGIQVDKDRIAELEAEVAGLKTGYEAYERVNAELKAENEALRGVMACVASEVHSHTNHNGNAPGHCHSVPGVWDRDNGAKAGKECAWCKVWNYAVAMGKGGQS